MEIREARVADALQIREVHLAAFADEGPVVADLALELMADESARPVLVLVAESGGVVVGSVIFSRVQIDGAQPGPACILAPLAVLPGMQQRGVGKGLVEAGLTALRQRGVQLVFVLGDPRYYSRFGFSAEHKVLAPHVLPFPQAWMCLSLGRVVPGSLAGRLVCAQSLSRPEHW